MGMVKIAKVLIPICYVSNQIILGLWQIEKTITQETQRFIEMIQMKLP